MSPRDPHHDTDPDPLHPPLPPIGPLDEDAAQAFADRVVDQWQRERARAARRRVRRPLALAAAVLLGLGGALWWTARVDPTSEPGPSPAVVQAPDPAPPGVSATPATDDRVLASPGAEYTLDGPADDRVVTLHDGTILCEVAPRRPGGRFRVLTGGATVEVVGTRFEVVATDEDLAHVHVHEGVVSLTLPDGGPALRLAAGDTWPPDDTDDTDTDTDTDPRPTLPPAPAPTTGAGDVPSEPGAPPDRTPPAPEPAAPAIPAAPDGTDPTARPGPEDPVDPSVDNPPPADHPLTRALDALDAGEPNLALTRLDDVPDALAPEAGFWRIVALLRAGSPLAPDAMRAHLAAHPDGPHAPVVHALLGRALVEAGQPEAAAPHLEAAAASSDPDARRAAEEAGY